MNEWWILSSDTSGACLLVVSKHHLALCLQASTKKQQQNAALFCPPAKIGAGSSTCLVERKDKVGSEGEVNTWLRERTGISTLCDITKCWLDDFWKVEQAQQGNAELFIFLQSALTRWRSRLFVGRQWWMNPVGGGFSPEEAAGLQHLQTERPLTEAPCPSYLLAPV